MRKPAVLDDLIDWHAEQAVNAETRRSGAIWSAENNTGTFAGQSRRRARIHEAEAAFHLAAVDVLNRAKGFS